jgi:Flp pilus assembly pilin Flp
MINRLLNIATKFFREEEAATAVEYALLVALIIIFSISAILGTGDVQKALWFDTADELQIIAPN